MIAMRQKGCDGEGPNDRPRLGCLAMLYAHRRVPADPDPDTREQGANVYKRGLSLTSHASYVRIGLERTGGERNNSIHFLSVVQTLSWIRFKTKMNQRSANNGKRLMCKYRRRLQKCSLIPSLETDRQYFTVVRFALATSRQQNVSFSMTSKPRR